MSLREIFDRNRTAKGRVGFDKLYEEVIGPRRMETLDLLEIGIDRGYSLESWLEWLPHALVTGVDTFERFPRDTINALEHARARCFQRSSAGPPPKGIGTFDFIIDDGCHWHAAQTMTFSRYWPLLREGGSYFIEDVWPFDVMSEKDKQHPWILSHPGAWTDAAFAELWATVARAACIEPSANIYRHDFRGIEGLDNSDHYIIEVRK